MNFKTTIFLLVILALVGGYFLLIERHAPTTYDRDEWAAQQGAQKGTPLFTADQLPTESVSSVTIQHHQGTPIEMVKQGEAWHQSRPVRFPLKTWSIKQLIDAAAALRYSQRFNPAGTDTGDLPTLEQARLAPPEAVVTLTIKAQSTGGDTEPHTQTIRLGRTGLGGRSYAMINEDPQVYVVDDALHTQVLSGKATEWRQRSIQAPSEGQADRVLLTRSRRTIELSKNEGRWSLAGEDFGRADTEAVTGLLNAVGSLYISEFVADEPPDLAVYGLTDPATVFTVYLSPTAAAQAAATPNGPPAATAPTDQPGGPAQADAEAYSLSIGAPVDLKNESYFAAWSRVGQPAQVVFAISAADTERFNKSVDDCRDHKITPVKAADVRGLTIEGVHAETVRLTRGVQGWSFDQPGPGFEADSGVTSSLVESVVGAQAVSFEPFKSFEPPQWLSGEPLATVTLAVIAQDDPEAMRVYAGDDDVTFRVLRRGETVVYVVEADKLGGLFEPVLSLRDRTVVDLPADGVARVTLEHADGTRLAFERLATDGTAATDGFTHLTSFGVLATGASSAAGDLGWWRLAGHERFESQAFSELLTKLVPLTAKRWLDAAGSTSGEGLSAGRVTVTIDGPSGVAHTVVFDTPGHRGALLDGTVTRQWFEVDDELSGLVAEEFRDRIVLTATADQIDSVTLVGDGNHTTTITRDDSGRFIRDDGQAADQAAAAMLFDTLAGLRVERFVQPQHLPQPPQRVVLKTQDGQTHRLAFSATPEGDGVLATNGDQWFYLTAEQAAKLRVPHASEP